jgi:hypothetical protein
MKLYANYKNGFLKQYRIENINGCPGEIWTAIYKN